MNRQIKFTLFLSYLQFDVEDEVKLVHKFIFKNLKDFHQHYS